MSGEPAMPVSPLILKSLACCSCQKSFHRRNNQEQKNKNPYLLNCGHTVCAPCCGNVKTNVISCGLCGCLTQLTHGNNPTSMLSRNAYVEGRISLGKSLLVLDNISYKMAVTENKNICENLELTSGFCYECSEAKATLTCQQCDCNFCDCCWTKVHSSGKSLQKHVPTTNNALNWHNIENCKVHKGKVLEFYCRECKVYACPNCVVLNHQGGDHKPVTLQERNSELFDEVDQLKKEVILNMKKMNAAVVEVKAMREKVQGRDDSYEELQRQVVQNFVQLHGVLQVAEESVLKRLQAAEHAKRDRLEEILLQLDRQIEKTKLVLKTVENLNDPKQLRGDVWLEGVLEALTTLKNLPSRLVTSDRPGKEDKPTLSFDETVIERLKKYCTLNVPVSDILELKSDGSDDGVLHVSEPKLDELSSQEEDDAASVKSRRSDRSDDSKKLSYTTHFIKSSSQPLSVLPMPKTEPLNIVEGNAYPVCIRYVKDPGEFYVMRSCLRKQEQKIDMLAPSLAARMKQPPTHIEKDEYYLVKYAADQKWYRGRVVDVLPKRNENNETVALIYYLDYGNKQEVPLSRMRDMPKVLREDPPLAIKCKLFSCLPRNGAWCKGSTKTMLDVLDKSVMIMYVMKVLPDCLEVDLCRRGPDEALEHELVSLRDMMIFLEYASFTARGDIKKQKRANLKYLTPVLPKVGDTFRGLITYVESDSLFYVQKIGPDTEYLLSLMDKLDSTYSKGNMKGLIYNPDLDMPCAAKYPQDGKWYRGEMIDFPGQEKLTVYYVDYGNKETVHWKSVRKLHPEFLKLIPQAIPCSLVKPSENANWRGDMKDRLEGYTTEILRVVVVGKSSGILNVMLYTSKDHCVNEEMLENGTRKEEQDCSDAKHGDGSAAIPQKRRKRKNGRKKEDVKVDELTKNSSDDVFRTEVQVLQVTSPSDIYVSLLCFSSRAEELENKLQEFYAMSEPDSNAKWDVDDRCAALSCKREKWYRATVAEILDNDRIRVVFKDIMETEDVPVSNTRVLDDRFFAYPIGAIKCHLSGIFPPETEWPGLTCEFLQSQLNSYEHVYMTKMGEINNNSLPIQLWVKKRMQGGALEPTTEEWVVLNDLIVEQGLAVPEKAKLIHHIITEEDVKPVDCHTPKFSDDVPSETDSFIPSLACDWPPPEPCRKDRFIGEATHVDSDGVIYIYDQEDKPVLDRIRASLLEHYENTKPQAHDQYWSEGQLCVVRYQVDGGWYRGKVLKVNEDCTYRVLFVDYGNEETCRITEMRKDVKHLDVPTLTRRYVIHGVSPVSSDGRWQSRVIDYIYSSVVEKCCDVTVMEKAPDICQASKVRIKVCQDGFDMADDLVSMGLAKYVSVTKPEEPTEVEAVPQVPVRKCFSELELPEDFKTFPIEVLVVKFTEFFARLPYEDSIPTDLRNIISDFMAMTDEIQRVAEAQEILADFTDGSPCVSFCSENAMWYRTEVVRYDTDRDLVIVRYVDFGNDAYMPKDRVRKCLTKWFNVPTMALKCRLHNVRICDGVKKTDYVQELSKYLSRPGITAEVVQVNEDVYVVEVKQDGELVYQSMLDDGLMKFEVPPATVRTDWCDLLEQS